MDTDSFIFHIKTKNIYEGIANVVEKRFEISNDTTERPVKKTKNIIGLMKDELGGKIMTKFVGLRINTYY